MSMITYEIWSVVASAAGGLLRNFMFLDEDFNICCVFDICFYIQW